MCSIPRYALVTAVRLEPGEWLGSIELIWRILQCVAIGGVDSMSVELEDSKMVPSTEYLELEAQSFENLGRASIALFTWAYNHPR